MDEGLMVSSHMNAGGKYQGRGGCRSTAAAQSRLRRSVWLGLQPGLRRPPADAALNRAQPHHVTTGGVTPIQTFELYAKKWLDLTEN